MKVKMFGIINILSEKVTIIQWSFGSKEDMTMVSCSIPSI